MMVKSKKGQEPSRPNELSKLSVPNNKSRASPQKERSVAKSQVIKPPKGINIKINDVDYDD